MFSVNGGWGGANHFFLRLRIIVLEEGKGYMHTHIYIVLKLMDKVVFFYFKEIFVLFIWLCWV